MKHSTKHSNDKHWTQDEFIDHLYGIAAGDLEHLRTCTDCSHQWNRVQLQRSALAAPAEPSPEFLAHQRREIYRKLDRPARPFFFQPGWAIGAAATAVLAVGIGVWGPSATPVKPAVQQESAIDASDAQLFREIADMEQTPLPRAAAPIRGLFEEQ
jgi:hypothetical protein